MSPIYRGLSQTSAWHSQSRLQSGIHPAVLFSTGVGAPRTDQLGSAPVPLSWLRSAQAPPFYCSVLAPIPHATSASFCTPAVLLHHCSPTREMLSFISPNGCTSQHPASASRRIRNRYRMSEKRVFPLEYLLTAGGRYPEAGLHLDH